MLMVSWNEYITVDLSYNERGKNIFAKGAAHLFRVSPVRFPIESGIFVRAL
jgi:hypothetical protein